MFDILGGRLDLVELNYLKLFLIQMCVSVCLRMAQLSSLGVCHSLWA